MLSSESIKKGEVDNERMGLSRSTAYYKLLPIKAEDLELMKLIDRQYLKTPFYGSLSMAKHLRRDGYKVNRKRIQRLMRLMRLEVVYPKHKTRYTYYGHNIYPYLLGNMSIERSNHVWVADITYLPMERGFICLVAVMDWSSRKVLS